MRFLGFVILLFSCIIAAVGTARAQVAGSISGTVTDSSGAAVPHANVTITELDTGQSRNLMTDDRGTYRVLALPVGRYEVKAEQPGFRTAVRTGITLVVGQEATVDVALQLGEATQQVAVSAEASLVDVSTAPISGLVGERQVKDLPLNGRSFDNLITLNPGTANITSNRSATSTGGGQGNNFSVSGNREDYNIFLLNGIEYTGVSTADVIPGGVQHNLAFTFFQLKDIRNARIHAAKALELWPEFADATILYGTILYMLREDRDAELVLAKAHQLRPADAGVDQLLADLRAHTNRNH